MTHLLIYILIHVHAEREISSLNEMTYTKYLTDSHGDDRPYYHAEPPTNEALSPAARQNFP